MRSAVLRRRGSLLSLSSGVGGGPGQDGVLLDDRKVEQVIDIPECNGTCLGFRSKVVLAGFRLLAHARGPVNGDVASLT